MKGKHRFQLERRLPPRVRLGVALDWRYFSKRVPVQYRSYIQLKRKDQEALRQLHARLVSEGVIRV